MNHGLKGVTDATVFCKSMQKGGAKPMIRSMKSYAEGGTTDTTCPPGKKGCRKVTKFRSSGRSSGKGEAGIASKIIGGVGAIGAALGLNKYVKNTKD